MSSAVTENHGRFVQRSRKISRPPGALLSVFGLLCVLLGSIAACVVPATGLDIGPAMAANMSEAGKPSVPSGPLTFTQCVELALKQSPFLSGSALEIDVRRLDEADARYGFVPSLSLRTRAFLNKPDDSQPYSIEFITEPFNPVESYFTLQARKVITDMAGLGHLQTISDFIHRLGLGFLELEALNQTEAYQDELISLAQSNRAYTTERLSSGGLSVLEARVAAQEADLAVLERERLASSKSTIEEGLKNLLGSTDSLDFSVNTTNARWQVLGIFDPAQMTYSQVQSDSIELKIQNLKQELQKRYITMARARFLPTLLFRLETADPLSRSQDGELFFSAGIELQLWDGLKRLHDITRQKIVLQQYNAEETMKDIDLAAKWRTAQDKLKNAMADLELAHAREELADLKKRKSEISYHSGSASFGAFLAESKALLDARKDTVLKSLEKDKAILGLRHLSGDLHKAYVDTSSF